MSPLPPKRKYISLQRNKWKKISWNSWASVRCTVGPVLLFWFSGVAIRITPLVHLKLWHQMDTTLNASDVTNILIVNSVSQKWHKMAFFQFWSFEITPRIVITIISMIRFSNYFQCFQLISGIENKFETKYKILVSLDSDFCDPVLHLWPKNMPKNKTQFKTLFSINSLSDSLTDVQKRLKWYEVHRE